MGKLWLLGEVGKWGQVRRFSSVKELMSLWGRCCFAHLFSSQDVLSIIIGLCFSVWV